MTVKSISMLGLCFASALSPVAVSAANEKDAANAKAQQDAVSAYYITHNLNKDAPLAKGLTIAWVGSNYSLKTRSLAYFCSNAKPCEFKNTDHGVLVAAGTKNDKGCQNFEVVTIYNIGGSKLRKDTQASICPDAVSSVEVVPDKSDRPVLSTEDINSVRTYAYAAEVSRVEKECEARGGDVKACSKAGIAKIKY